MAAVDLAVVPIVPKLGEKCLRESYSIDRYNNRPKRQEARLLVPIASDQVVHRTTQKDPIAGLKEATPKSSRMPFVDLRPHVPKAVQFTGMDYMHFYDDKVPTNSRNK